MKLRRIITALIILILSGSAAKAEDKAGEVKLTLNDYNNLVEASKGKPKDPRPAPAGYALGQADVSLDVTEHNKNASASVTANISIKVLEDDWVTVPILPAGSAVSYAAVSGQTVELMVTAKGLAWSAKEKGSYVMSLKYSMDATRSDNGYSLAIPVPEAAAINLTATVPGTGLDVAVLPSSGVKSQIAGESTTVTATVPTTSGLHLSWRIPGKDKPSISRAVYKGTLSEDAITWSGEFAVDIPNDETVTLPLFPQSVTLRDVMVDGQKAPILVENGQFATRVKGRGLHKLTIEFDSAVLRTSDGPPQVHLSIPAIPVSRLELTLPGKKEVTVKPSSQVANKLENDATVATVYVPMTNQVSLSWTEAVPEEFKAELRANASLYHTLRAEEGALSVNAIGVYEITRGETNLIQLIVPENVQINRVTAATGGIADWRVDTGKDTVRMLNIFLDRKVKDDFQFSVEYDRSLLGESAKNNISVPLLRAHDIHRQRGMVALLSSKELTLKPLEEEHVTRVGENQLPAFVRQGIIHTIAHTFKYVEDAPKLIVQATTPEKQQGKFDALVNTLISLSDITLTGAASVEINVKSGSISELQLTLPNKVNLLSLTGPSIRTFKTNPEEGRQRVDVQFTQDMEGQFRLEATYEYIMAESDANLGVPTLAVKGAEVEQGKIGVEALAAVEVQAAQTDQLSSLDPSELPQQLILKTTNPILLAYKYVHVDPPYKLALKVTRHKEIEIRAATIDLAHYHTLFTRDGMAVTAAQFLLRNSREQFLRVKLPEGSKVWSVFVDGKAEKPALAEKRAGEGKSGPEVLIKIISSAQGFTVNLTYQTPVSTMGSFGTVTASLPRPDMIVTNSRWNVYLPDDLSYTTPRTNMQIIAEGERFSPHVMEQELARFAAVSGQAPINVGQLQINVPATGIRYTFEKLYANQSELDAFFSLPYTSKAGAVSSSALVVIGTLLICLALASRFKTGVKASSRAAFGSFVAGAALLSVFVGYLGVSFTPGLAAIAAVIVLAAVMKIRERKAETQDL